jgi:hypothetical protein
MRLLATLSGVTHDIACVAVRVVKAKSRMATRANVPNPFRCHGRAIQELGSRFKVATPTANGRRAQEFYRQWADEVEQRFGEGFTKAACRDLREHSCRLLAIMAPIRSCVEAWIPFRMAGERKCPNPRSFPTIPSSRCGMGFPMAADG